MLTKSITSYWATVRYFMTPTTDYTVQWRHYGRDSVSNHQPQDYLLNRLFRRTSKKTSKFRVTGLYVGDSPVTGEFPAQMASNAQNVSIWWRYHEMPFLKVLLPDVSGILAITFKISGTCWLSVLSFPSSSILPLVEEPRENAENRARQIGPFWQDTPELFNGIGGSQIHHHWFR